MRFGWVGVIGGGAQRKPAHIVGGADCCTIMCLQAIVDKLLKTKDEILCSGGEIVWLVEHGQMQRFVVVYEACSDTLNEEPGGGWSASHVFPNGAVNSAYSIEVECCYSTREAAEEANHANA